MKCVFLSVDSENAPESFDLLAGSGIQANIEWSSVAETVISVPASDAPRARKLIGQI